jgi:hypothetical protein
MSSSARSRTSVRIGLFAAVLGIAALAFASGHVGQATPAKAAPPVKNVYQVKGLAGDFYQVSYTGPTTDPYCSGTSVSVSASGTSTHLAGSGDRSEYAYGYASYSKWDYCSGPYLYEYGYGYGSVDLSGGQQALGLSGTVALSGWEYTPSGSGPISTSATIDVDITADGEYSSFGQSSNSYSYPGATYRYRYVGWSASATASGSFVVDGNDLMSDTPDYSYGSIYKNNSGQVEMFTF